MGHNYTIYSKYPLQKSTRMNHDRQQLIKLWNEEEALRHALMVSKPILYVENTAQYVDNALFKTNPYERYAVGIMLGLFIDRVWL